MRFRDHLVIGVLCSMLVTSFCIFYYYVWSLLAYMGALLFIGTIWLWYKKFTYSNYYINLSINYNTSLGTNGYVLSLIGGDKGDVIWFSVHDLKYMVDTDLLINILAQEYITFTPTGELCINGEHLSAINFVGAIRNFCMVKNKLNLFFVGNLGKVIKQSVKSETKSKKRFEF